MKSIEELITDTDKLKLGLEQARADIERIGKQIKNLAKEIEPLISQL